MNQRQALINVVVIILLVVLALGVTWSGLAGIAQAASAPVTLTEKVALALPRLLPPTSTILIPSVVTENMPIGTVVGNFSTSDPDPTDTFTYALTDTVSFPDNINFEIVGDSLKTTAMFDFEITNSYTISVFTADSDGDSLVTNFIINIVDVNEDPTNINLSNSTIAENAAISTTVGVLSEVDPDAGGSYTYTLVAGTGDNNNTSFDIIAGNTLVNREVFNYEVKNSYNIRVQVMDNGGLTFEKPFTITVTDVNENPTDINLGNSTIAENQPSGTTVGVFSTTEPDTNQSHTYTLTDTGVFTDNNLFTIVSDTLKTATTFNYEAKNSYTIKVRTDDGNGGTFDKVFTITVTNVNETPTDVALSSTSVAENLGINTVVGTLSTTDPDDPGGSDSYFYTLVTGAGSTDNGSFNINGNALRIEGPFNFEAKSSYSIRVRTTDGTGLFFEKQFTITVTDVNESPTNLALSGSSIAENLAANTVVGTLSTSDPEDPGSSGTYTYTLVTGTGSTDNGSFNISGNALRINAPFNFEAKASYSIRVRTTDSGGLFFEKQFTITVTDVNESPTDLALSSTSIAENLITNTVVGTLSTTDPDDPGSSGTYTYTLVAGGTDNGSFNLSGNALRINAPFNYEVKSSYSIRVRTTDGGGLYFEKSFTITVTDVNENPTGINLSNTIIAENLPSGTTVGTLTQVDPDTTGSYTYTLISAGFPDNTFFTINGNALKAAAVFDFVSKSSYTIGVRVTDNGGLFFEKQFTITITDVLPAIVVTKTANPTSVPETGANVTFTIRITNTSQENATISIFSDNKFLNLGTLCPTAIGTTITPGNNYTCSFTAFISGDYPGSHQNTVTAVAGDNESHASVASGSATVNFTDVLPNLSVVYTSTPANVNEPGGNVTFSVLVTNLSTETGTLTLLQDSIFGNLNGHGDCTLNGTLSPNGGTYSCSFTQLVSGTQGQTRAFIATAQLMDDDTNTMNVSDDTSVSIGEMRKVYLPIITRPPFTDLSVFNDSTGGNVTFTVVGTGVSCTIPNNSTLFCGSFPAGTYTIQVVSACGSASTSKTYDNGPQTTRIFCQ